MKSKIAAVIILFFVSSFFTGCKKDKEDTEEKYTELNLLTYNVAGLPEGISSSQPQLYTSSISPLLNEFNVVHVQEDFNYHDSLLLYLTKPHKTQTSGIAGYGDGLNTFSDFPIHDFYRETWLNCNGADCYTPKGFSYSRIEVQPGTFIDFYNVHCNAGSNELSLAARRGNMIQLTNHIKAHSGSVATIVMGDFNNRYTRDGDTVRMMFDLGFKDAWIELIRGGEVPLKGTSSLNDCDNSPRTSADCERVDKFFYKGNNQIEIVATSYVLDDSRYYYQGNDTLQLSDHWPVFVKIKYRAK